MEDASGVVFFGMRDAKGGGACRGSRGRLRGGGALKENKLFFPVKGSKGLEGSKCLYSGRVLGHTRFPWASV